MLEHDSFTTLMRERASSHGDRVALVFCHDPADESGDEPLTYADLDLLARRVAVMLRAHAKPGDRVLLLHEPGTGFAKGFLGALYAGMIAVPSPAPDGYRRQRERLAAIARDAGVTAVLTDARALGSIREWAAEAGLDGLACLAVDEELPPADGWSPPAGDARTPAFLQYTSGSTGDPKGVVVDHGNLLANVEVFNHITGATPDDRFGGWLPMYHDFGLIGQLLIPLANGTTTVLMSPIAFVKRPHAWLRMIDRHGINVSPAPNFAYELCVQRITDAQVAGLDLSRWSHALNGSEPIRAGTLRAFAERFAPYGLRPGALSPGYGLAEATLAVSCTPKGNVAVVTPVDAERRAKGEFAPSSEGEVRNVPSSGHAEPGIDIVDPQSRVALPEGQVGEIWLRGPHVARGYWQRPETNKKIFDVETAGGEGGYLRTGDLGVIHEGELYVTGRIKELLIVRGRNLYPQDLEEEARTAHPALARGVGAVFTVPAPEEEVVVVHECRIRDLGETSPSELAEEIRVTLGREFGVSVAGVVLVRPSEVRRTTSGKIQRGLTRDLFISGELTVVHEELTSAVRDRYRVGV
jgi:acyl-CoA synthetase (AMP-forming)/AMP-acid ligase II